MADPKDDPPTLAPMTRLARAGRPKDITGPFINPPVVHASTVLFENTDAMERRQRYNYARRGTPTSEALEMAIGDLEGAHGVVLCPSGLSAISTALLSSLSAGDHLLLVDCVYEPARHFAETVLKRLGVNVDYFAPDVSPEAFAGMFRERTAAVHFESPGSLSFEMQDIPALAAIAKAHGATVIVDNTWATGFYFRPLAVGADLVIHAGTKYIGGHADVSLGMVAANASAWRPLKSFYGAAGLCVGPDDIYLGLRGFRTLGIRLDRHMRSALAVARWLQARPEVSRVLHPALPTDPGHALWKRDMEGASGLFAIEIDEWREDQAKRFIDGLQLFGIGFSWGGFESLAVLCKPAAYRTAVPWTRTGQLVRLHIGLEDPADLIADLERGFAAVAGEA